MTNTEDLKSLDKLAKMAYKLNAKITTLYLALSHDLDMNYEDRGALAIEAKKAAKNMARLYEEIGELQMEVSMRPA